MLFMQLNQKKSEPKSLYIVVHKIIIGHIYWADLSKKLN